MICEWATATQLSQRSHDVGLGVRLWKNQISRGRKFLSPQNVAHYVFLFDDADVWKDRFARKSTNQKKKYAFLVSMRSLKLKFVTIWESIALLFTLSFDFVLKMGVQSERFGYTSFSSSSRPFHAAQTSPTLSKRTQTVIFAKIFFRASAFWERANPEGGAATLLRRERKLVIYLMKQSFKELVHAPALVMAFFPS